MMCEYIQKEEDNDVNKHDFVLPLLERQGGGMTARKRQEATGGGER